MEYVRHGFSVDIERTDDSFLVTLKATGKLSHKDYEKITALLDSALDNVKHPELNILFDASEFQGWELRAALDDFKLGLEHFKEFKKIAIHGNKLWLAVLAKITACFVPAEVKYFEDLDDASSWIVD